MNSKTVTKTAIALCGASLAIVLASTLIVVSMPYTFAEGNENGKSY